MDKFHFASVENFKPKPNELLKRSHCTPDGFFIRDGKSYVWEAKNWPLYPENGPEQQIWKYLSNNPWILATSANLSSSEKEISGFLFSFWNIPSITRARIEEQVNQIIGMGKFEIILTCDIIDDCIKEQYVWYRQIIEQEKENVGKFFIQLLGVE